MVFFPIDIDECASINPCEHTCINAAGSFVCVCNKGYILVDGTRCEGMSLCVFFMPHEDCDTNIHQPIKYTLFSDARHCIAQFECMYMYDKSPILLSTFKIIL